MVEEIKFSNSAYGYYDVLTMNRTDADYLLDDDEGIDWGSTSSNFSTVESLSGLGNTVNKIKSTDPRPISITGWIVGTEQEIENKKLYLSKIISPMDNLKITINSTYYIDVIVTSAVKFAINSNQNNEVMCKFFFTVQAPFPFFKKDIAISFTDLSSTRYLQNHGCSAVGAEFQFHLQSGVSDLSLEVGFDGRSQEFLIPGEIASGWYTISTKEGRKQNDFGWSHWDLDNDWIEIPKTLFDTDYVAVEASVSSGNLSNVSLDIFFSELYTTLEDL